MDVVGIQICGSIGSSSLLRLRHGFNTIKWEVVITSATLGHRHYCVASWVQYHRRGGKIATIEDQIEEKKNKSELANYVWKLKQLKKNFTIKWKIEKKAQPYRKGARYCNLCALEKTCIALGDPSSTLNSRNEIFHKCRSKTKFTLQNFLPP